MERREKPWRRWRRKQSLEDNDCKKYSGLPEKPHYHPLRQNKEYHAVSSTMHAAKISLEEG